MKVGQWRAFLVVLSLGVLAGCVNEPAHPASAAPNRHLAWSLPVSAGQGLVTSSVWVRPTAAHASFGFVAAADVEAGTLAGEGRGFVLTSAFFENMTYDGRFLDRVDLPGAAASVGLPYRETVGAWLNGRSLVGPLTTKEYPNGWSHGGSAEATFGRTLPSPVKLVWSVAYSLPPVLHAPVARFWLNATGDVAIDADPTVTAVLGPTAAGFVRWNTFDGNATGFDAGPRGPVAKSDGLQASFQTAGNTWISWLLQDSGSGRADFSWRNDQGFSRAVQKPGPTTGGIWFWGYHSCRSEAWRIDSSHATSGPYSFALLYASLPVAEPAPLLGMAADPDKDPNINACNAFPGVLRSVTYSTTPGIVG